MIRMGSCIVAQIQSIHTNDAFYIVCPYGVDCCLIDVKIPVVKTLDAANLLRTSSILYGCIFFSMFSKKCLGIVQ